MKEPIETPRKYMHIISFRVDEWEYLTLAKRSISTGKSISVIMREMVQQIDSSTK